jgi:hypothetical protein
MVFFLGAFYFASPMPSGKKRLSGDSIPFYSEIAFGFSGLRKMGG